MQISNLDLSKMALKLLETLDREKIQTLQDLLTKLGAETGLDPENRDKVIFGRAISAGATCAFVVDYLRRGAGIPIEMRFNPELEYSRLIVKCMKEIRGYSTFAVDPFSNLVQFKDFDYLKSRLGRSELRFLSSLKD